jgi:MSHA biogenesis protein MshI
LGLLILLFQKLFRKQKQNKGIVGISYLPNGIAIAAAGYIGNGKLRLNYCEYIPTLTTAEQATVLRQLVVRNRLDDYDCHLVLATDNYRRLNIEEPKVAENEMNEAIRWKITDLIDFPAEKAAIDYYSLPASTRANSSKMLEVVASPGDLIKEIADISKQAGLQIRVIDILETVLRNLAILLPENKRGVAVLYLQESSGTILVLKQNTIYLSRNFDIGYRELGLSLIDSSDDNEHINEQNNLALEIQRSLDYVESYYGIPPISGLAVIPLAQNTQNLLNILNSNHGITARIMDLTAIVDSDILLDDTTQSRCSPVIGATLRYAVEA